MDPVRLAIARSKRAHVARLSMAGVAVLAYIGLVLVDQFMAAMFFSEPSAALPLVISPLLLAAAWIAWMAGARGVLEVHHDRLVIRHPRVLRRPLVVPRSQVARVLLDSGEATGRARFATGDEVRPLLWTDPVPRRQHVDRPLIGDGLLPNLAIELAWPLAVHSARDPVTAAPAPGDVPPPRRGDAHALLVAVDDLEAARAALAGWRVEQPDAARFVPPQVAAAAAQVPRDAATLLLLAGLVAALTLDDRLVGMLVWFPLAFLLVHRITRRRQAQAAAAREEVERRAPFMTAADRAAALAAVDANLGPPPSQGPPPAQR